MEYCICNVAIVYPNWGDWKEKGEKGYASSDRRNRTWNIS